MKRRWRWLALLVLIIALVMIAAYSGRQAYYRSDYYRRKATTRLSSFFGLPIEIDNMKSLGFSGMQFFGLSAWLPDHRSRVLQAPEILWDESVGGKEGGVVVHLHDAHWTLGQGTWQSGDYMRVLRASLAHDFKEVNLRRAVLHDNRIEWFTRDFHLVTEKVEGRIEFEPDGTGRAALTAATLNGRPVSSGIEITARIDPMADDLIPEVSLQVPAVPLDLLGLDDVLASRLTQGQFAGQLTIRQSSATNEFVFAGHIKDVRLDEATPRLPGGAVGGTTDLVVREALVRNGRLVGLSFSGEWRDMEFETLWGRWSPRPLGGRVQLAVQEGRLSESGIESLRLRGEWRGASLDALCQMLLGRSGLAGRLLMNVHSFHVEKNTLKDGDIDIGADLPRGGTGAISKALLVHLLGRIITSPLPEPLIQMLPERIEFSQFGARLRVSGHKLRITSVAGPAGPALLTTRVFGRDVPFLGTFDVAVDLAPFEQAVRQAIERVVVTVRQKIGDGGTDQRSSNGDQSQQ